MLSVFVELEYTIALSVMSTEDNKFSPAHTDFLEQLAPMLVSLSFGSIQRLESIHLERIYFSFMFLYIRVTFAINHIY